MRTVVACSGARNAPLLEVLDLCDGLDVVRLVDERSACFFALGRVKATASPAAVFTTSGTAAAELLPAMVEAHYSGLPLVAVTADRPRRFRGTGAPQSICQVGLFGSHVELCVDLAGEDVVGELDRWSGSAPLHVNICFDEPLIDGVINPEPMLTSEPRASRPQEEVTADQLAELHAFLEEVRTPMVIVGELPASAKDSVAEFLGRLGAPVYAETPSGLRGHTALRSLLLTSGEGMVSEALSSGRVGGVLRLGSVPTLRAWRDLDGRFARVPVLSVSSAPFCGLGRPDAARAPLPLGVLSSFGGEARLEASAVRDISTRDRQQALRLQEIIASHPAAEASLLHEMAVRLPAEVLLYLGNSLPIREWDLVAPVTAGWDLVGVNRGANGIDGQLSTLLGMCRPGRPSFAVLGDLTTMYDANAPFALRQLDERVDLTLVIVNNGGGRIFEGLFADPRYQSPHHLGFEAWAAWWGLAHERLVDVPASLTPRGRRVLELCPDPAESSAFRRAYAELWRSP